jgi:hypothetical protein
LLDHAADGCYCYKARPSTAVCQNDCGPANARKLLALLSALSNSSPSWLQEQIEKATGPLKDGLREVQKFVLGEGGIPHGIGKEQSVIMSKLIDSLCSAPITDAKEGA